MTALLSASDLGRDFGAVRALERVSLSVEPGELLCVQGPSGCGKSTLLSLLAGLDRPTRGAVSFRGTSLADLSPGRAAALRRRHMGFVFQDFRLVRHLSGRANVRLPLDLIPAAPRAAERVDELLARVGMADLAGRRPGRLSRGEQQRLAVARAFVHRPAVVFADEPTASLDPASRAAVWDLLERLRAEEGVALVTATHDPGPVAGRILRLEEGRCCDA